MKNQKQTVKILGIDYKVGTKAHAEALYRLKLINQVQRSENS